MSAIRNSVTGRMERTIDSITEERIKDLYKNGTKAKDIVPIVGVSISAIYKIVIAAKLTVKQPSAKLETEMLDLYKTGMSQAAIAKKLGVSQQTVCNRLKPHDIVRQRGTWVQKGRPYGKRKSIIKDGLKLCTACERWKLPDLFPKSTLSLDGRRPKCVVCDDRDHFIRRERYRKACPEWVDGHALADVYLEAKLRTKAEGIQYNVDHIVPMGGRKVSGLHVPWNLRVITQAENFAKHNKHESD